MWKNFSPWINQLNSSRETTSLNSDEKSDVAIVGGGIAGIMTAYFTLRDTPYSVILLEATKVAHGATGHNAGQAVSYFERPFSELVEEFGLELAAKGQDDILSAWDLLETIYQEANLKTPISQFTGYAGCSSLKQILNHLSNRKLLHDAGVKADAVLIAEEADILQNIPAEYSGLYAIVPQSNILSLLETEDTQYIAALASRKGCFNSALLSEEIAGFLLSRYPERFLLKEHTPVDKVILEENSAVLTVKHFKVEVKKVVLCTNGFENIEIINHGGDIDKKFHEIVKGTIGYMAGYLEPLTRPATACSYFTEKDIESPYFYFTRRDYEMEKNEIHSLVCVGGPELEVENKFEENNHEHYFEKAQSKIDDFLRSTYMYIPSEIDYKFRWNGLMGYTPNRVRCIGPEPLNPILLYNLGCNGVGILPSIYGGKRISLFLKHGKLEKSIFDPINQSVLKI